MDDRGAGSGPSRPRRRSRTWWPSSGLSGEDDVKLLWLVMTGLILLVMVLALRVSWPRAPSPDCTSSVVIARGRHGEPVECVCVGGTISTCFDPGP